MDTVAPKASPTRTTTSASARTEPMNSTMNGSPMISTDNPADSDTPVTAQVK